MSGICHLAVMSAKVDVGFGNVSTSFNPTLTSATFPSTAGNINTAVDLVVKVSGFTANTWVSVPIRFTPATGVSGRTGFYTEKILTDANGIATIINQYNPSVYTNAYVKVECFGGTIQPNILINQPPVTLDSIPTAISAYRLVNGDIGATNPPAEGSIQFKSNGTATVYEDNFGGSGNYSNYNYYTPTTAGIGSNFYIKIQQIITGSLYEQTINMSTYPLNTIVQMSNNYTVGLTHGLSGLGSSFSTATIRVSIYSDSGGVNLLDTIDIDFEVGYES